MNPSNAHRGLLHHFIITVSDLKRSSPFYATMFRYLGYELSGSNYAEGYKFEDWKRWDGNTPHEFGICEVWPEHRSVKHVMGALGHHHHMAFCALDRADVDRFYAEVLVPLEKAGHCVVEDPPCDCPEHGKGYYATFFLDPDGLKYEYVINPAHLEKKAARDKP